MGQHTEDNRAERSRDRERDRERIREREKKPTNLGDMRAPSILTAMLNPKAAVPNLFGTRDQFHGRQFFHGRGVGGMAQAVMRAMGSGR